MRARLEIAGRRDGRNAERPVAAVRQRDRLRRATRADVLAEVEPVRTEMRQRHRRHTQHLDPLRAVGGVVRHDDVAVPLAERARNKCDRDEAAGPGCQDRRAVVALGEVAIFTNRAQVHRCLAGVDEPHGF